MNKTAITVKNLTKKFNSFTAVNNLSFDVYKGEIFGFLGPNGAGKTTTIKMLCGLLTPDSGTLNYLNHSSHSSCPLIGYCPQENIHWKKLTCYEQLRFMAGLYKLPSHRISSRIDSLLDAMFLTPKKNIQARNLSGGMQRRLNICLSLIHNPDIIIFDEPEDGLDPQSRAWVREYIRSLSREKTVILTTHNMDEADRLADRIAIIDQGKLISEGSPENLKRILGNSEILEIRLTAPEKIQENTLSKIKEVYPDCELTSSTLVIRKMNISRDLQEIKSMLETLNLSAGEFTLRQNSLEDVFLHLTGRSLRP